MRIILIFCMLAIVLLADSKTVEIKIKGMTCPMCTTAVKKSLKKVKGVSKAKVKLNTEIATVTFDDRVKQEDLLQAIRDLGYTGKFISVK